MSGLVAMRAPAEDGAVVAEPPLSEVGRLLAENRRRLEGADVAWAERRREARQAAVGAARAYFSDHSEPVPDWSSEHLILAGHQPELFHPGVWVKNFALSGLARRHGLTPINLIVDNDTVKSTALRLPSPAAVGSSHPHAILEPFDRWTGEIPWEERPILDAALFAGFADRARDILRGWHYTPMLPEFWADVIRHSGRITPRFAGRPQSGRPTMGAGQSQSDRPTMGECFATARRTWERRWGCHNLELPVSLLCGTAPFARFACDLLAELPRFHAVYNECVREYRRRHGIRSRNHPVPDLAAEDGWLEAPFWGWKAGASRRGRLFARPHLDRIELRIGDETWPALPARQPEATWAELERRGLKVRSRALTNTLYARLFLADLFIHGIGGGKYDELTDELIRRFWGLEPPSFLVLSATRLLPLPSAPVRTDDRRRLARGLRDLHWNPQRHLPADGAQLRELADRKSRLIAEQPSDTVRKRDRFQALRAATAELRAPLAEEERRLREQLTGTDRMLEANSVLRRRDYAFCLYPDEMLRPFSTQFL